MSERTYYDVALLAYLFDKKWKSLVFDTICNTLIAAHGAVVVGEQLIVKALVNGNVTIAVGSIQAGIGSMDDENIQRFIDEY